jgi:hypothetical protein
VSIEDSKVIDAIGIETTTGKVVLTISDHLDWTSDTEHLDRLRDKINTYVRFIESGEINASYPDAIGRPRVIDVVTKFEQPTMGRDFIENAMKTLSRVGIELRTRVHKSEHNS